MMFSRFFRRATPAPEPHTLNASLPPGERVYAIGDVHGRLDLLDALLDQIHRDDLERAPARTTIVFLGDLVDRGPDSQGVVRRAMAVANQGDAIFIMGNHEELLLRLCSGNKRFAAPFHRVGGRATLLSYGVTAEDYDRHELRDLPALAAEAIPRAHTDFISGFISSWRCGDYFFTHAGVAPGVDLDEQRGEDMRWIREEFTESDVEHGAMIVHGHTITDAVEERANRIGIDTGAYASGHLTALCLQGRERWYLQT